MNHGTYDSILDMILYHVNSTPDRIAVKCGAQHLTYRQLDQQADLIAGYLEHNDVPRNAIVAVAMERTVQLMAVCLGIMKHGCAYLPIDIDNPEHRIKNILDNAGVECIFSDAESFPRQGFCAMTVNPHTIFSQAYPRKNISGPRPSTCAYCIYTSGSTGAPKGVLISHGALLNHTQWFIEAFAVNEADIILQRTSIAFDASVWELWTGLAAGACTVMLPAAYAKHPLGILLTLQREHITIAQFVPTLLRELVRLRQFEHIPCRLVFCGGESLTWELADLFLAKTRTPLVNLYGPTETTIDATFWRVNPDADRALPAPIGQPIRGMQVYLLDEQGKPVALPHQEGEIVIAGPGVAIGYVNSPHENELRFTSLNLDGHALRTYKTGDIGFFSTTGDLHYLGRRDSQYKINGHRVELLAIEEIVQQTPGVHSAAAYIDTLVSAEKQICVAFVPQGDTDTHAVEQRIRQALSLQLPSYMHPSRIQALSELPLLPNGKINHNTLRELAFQPDTGPTEIDAQTSTAVQLQSIWTEVLNQQSISSDSHFFERGATSLSVMMLLGRIANLFNVYLSPKDIFDHPVLAQQVTLLGECASHGAENAMLLDAYAWRRRVGEQTPGLAQLEILDKPAQTPAYLENVVLAFYIQGTCSAIRVREAFATVLAQQPALRCSFTLNAHGQWRRTQHVIDDFPLPFHVINLEPQNQSDDTVTDLVVQASLTAFDLSSPPLIRATYIQCPEANDVLIITAHHIAFDGWSGAVLMEQLCAHYQAPRGSVAPEQIVHCLSYSDYTDAQHQRFTEKLLDKHLDFWRQALEHLPEPFALRGAGQRPDAFTFRSAVIPLNLDAQYPAIEHLCNRSGFSLYTIILSAFLVALARNTGTEDLYVRSPVANRIDAALESVVGYFVHPMVIRPKLSHWSPSLHLLEQINHCVLDAYGHALLPPHLFEANCSPRSSAYGSRFPYWYNHHNYPSRQRHLGDAPLRGIGVPSTGIKTDVSLNTVRTDSGLIGSLSYYRDGISQVNAQALLADFHQALNQLLTIA